VWKLRVEIRFRRSAKRDCHWVDFHETQGLFDNSLFKKNPVPIPKFMISHKRFSYRQQATNGRTCSPLFGKEGLIWQTIFERYMPTVNTTWLPLPNICLQSNQTQSIFIGGANDRLCNPAIYFAISESCPVLINPPPTSNIQTYYTKKKHFFTLELGKNKCIYHTKHVSLCGRCYKAPCIYAITHKQGRATPTSTMDYNTQFTNTLYNAHANRRHTLRLTTLLYNVT
jgi:hypothetical protein